MMSAICGLKLRQNSLIIDDDDGGNDDHVVDDDTIIIIFITMRKRASCFQWLRLNLASYSYYLTVRRALSTFRLCFVFSSDCFAFEVILCRPSDDASSCDLHGN